jgi:hyperosmotically inducible protein
MRVTSIVKPLIVPVVIGALAIAVPAAAQDSAAKPAGESMHQAGESMKQAGSDTLNAAKQAAKGTATAMSDAKITAKVKLALHDAGISKQGEIHVSTTAGVVELSGRVPSSNTAVQAVQLARETEGVRSVNNDLRVTGPVRAD